jgi:hypothetical protein
MNKSKQHGNFLDGFNDIGGEDIADWFEQALKTI